MDEYDLVQRLREMWTKSIETWARVSLFLGAGIVSIFTTLFVNATSDQRLVVGITGWLLFSICMVYWRSLVHHIDDQIVGLYPSMLRLDRINKYETNARYYYSNLTNASLKWLTRNLSLQEQLRGDEYERFRETVGKKRKNFYRLLLDVWRTFGRDSVGSRGHSIQDASAFGAITILLTIVLSTSCWPTSLLALLLFFVIWIPWCWWRRWWFFRPDQGGTFQVPENETQGDLQRKYIRSQVSTYFFAGLLTLAALGILCSKTIPSLSIDNAWKIALTLLSVIVFGAIVLASLGWCLVLSLVAARSRILTRMRAVHRRIEEIIAGPNEHYHYFAWLMVALISLAGCFTLMVQANIGASLVISLFILGILLLVYLIWQSVQSFQRRN